MSRSNPPLPSPQSERCVTSRKTACFYTILDLFIEQNKINYKYYLFSHFSRANLANNSYRPAVSKYKCRRYETETWRFQRFDPIQLILIDIFHFHRKKNFHTKENIFELSK